GDRQPRVSRRSAMLSPRPALRRGCGPSGFNGSACRGDKVSQAAYPLGDLLGRDVAAGQPELVITTAVEVEGTHRRPENAVITRGPFESLLIGEERHGHHHKEATARRIPAQPEPGANGRREVALQL